MKNELYNISPDELPADMRTAKEIEAEAENGQKLFYRATLGGETQIPARLAFVRRGWVVAVSDRGQIVKDWAGLFTLATDADYTAATEARRARR